MVVWDFFIDRFDKSTSLWLRKTWNWKTVEPSKLLRQRWSPSSTKNEESYLTTELYHVMQAYVLISLHTNAYIQKAYEYLLARDIFFHRSYSRCFLMYVESVTLDLQLLLVDREVLFNRNIFNDLDISCFLDQNSIGHRK